MENVTIVVTKLDIFCGARKEVMDLIDELSDRRIRIHILNMGLIGDTSMENL